jgi:predicted RNase H-like nuclease (RuvC/YqgF family)
MFPYPKTMHPVIVGIDPGTTSAFAVLSFDFKVMAVKSKKEYSLAGIIQDIYQYGNPILVGTDKKEIPSFIKEFSQKTGAKIFSPKYDTKKGEKLFIVKEKKFIDLVKNTHETDALASAIYAYNEYLQLIKKVDSFIEKNNKQELRDKLLIKVITEDKNIFDALSELEKKPVKRITEEKTYPIFEKKELSKEQKEIMLLRELIGKLKEEIKSLQKENFLLKDKKIDISRQTKNMLSFKENKALQLEKQNKLLKKDLELKESIIKKLDFFISISANSVLLKRLKNLGIEEYKNKKDLLNLEKEDILLVEDTSIISEHVIHDIKKKIRIIVYERGKPIDGLIMIEKDCLRLFETKYFALAEKTSFNKTLESKIASAKKNVDYLKSIIEDYKRERELSNM